MNIGLYNFNNLFEQLGLENTNDAIETFLLKQPDISVGLPLHNASIWTVSQATFLKEAKEQDAEWSHLVDELDMRLRKS